MRAASIVAAFLTGTIFASFLALAWTGPTSPPPGGNVDAPLNIGTTDQVKDAGLGLNSLAVFGNAILSGASRYLNFGTIPGASGYGIRDNGGTMQFKNFGGSWQSATSTIQSYFASGSSNTVSQIKFADGTTQTTAGGGFQWGTKCRSLVQTKSGTILLSCAANEYLVNVSVADDGNLPDADSSDIVTGYGGSVSCYADKSHTCMVVCCKD